MADIWRHLWATYYRGTAFRNDHFWWYLLYTPSMAILCSVTLMRVLLELQRHRLNKPFFFIRPSCH